MVVEPEDEYVPEELHPFCDAMCSILEATHILPGIAANYRQAQEALDEQGPSNGGGSSGLLSEEDAQKGLDYGDMDDAPDEEPNV